MQPQAVSSFTLQGHAQVASEASSRLATIRRHEIQVAELSSWRVRRSCEVCVSFFFAEVACSTDGSPSWLGGMLSLSVECHFFKRLSIRNQAQTARSIDPLAFNTCCHSRPLEHTRLQALGTDLPLLANRKINNSCGCEGLEIDGHGGHIM